MPTIRGKYIQNRFPLVRIVVSNNVPEYGFDDDPNGPIVEGSKELCALIDTGATNSIIHSTIPRELGLYSQTQKQVLLAGMDLPTFCPVYTCALFFHADFDPQSATHEWTDLAALTALDLVDREYRAIIGMDILSQGKLSIEHGAGIVFEY